MEEMEEMVKWSTLSAPPLTAGRLLLGGEATNTLLTVGDELGDLRDRWVGRGRETVIVVARGPAATVNG